MKDTALLDPEVNLLDAPQNDSVEYQKPNNEDDDNNHLNENEGKEAEFENKVEILQET